MSKDIRLRFSGLVIFSARIFSIFTGLAFSILLTRFLSEPEFGVWRNLNAVISTFGLAGSIFPYWAARYTARNFQGAMKLGLIANVLLAVPIAILAFLLGPVLASAANTSAVFYFYATLILLQSYVIVALDSVVTVVKTHSIGYALAIYEIVKLLFAFLLIVVLHIGIPGALTALFVANCGWIATYVLVLRNYWAEKIDYRYFASWLKGSFLNFYSVGSGLLGSLDAFILLFKGGSVAVAIVGAAAIVAGPVAYTTSLSAALYPTLLSGGTAEDVETVWRTSLLFSIPLTLALFGLAPSFLAILKADYVVASFILALLVFRAFGSTIGAIFDTVITGSDRLDMTGSFTIGQAIRSRIFLGISTGYIIDPFYLVALWFLLQPFSADPLRAAQVAALLGLLQTLAVLPLKYLIARRAVKLRFPTISALKYSLVSGALVAVAFLLPQPLSPFTTLSVFAIGAIIYFLVLYFIEDEARLIIKSVLQYARLLALRTHR